MVEDISAMPWKYQELRMDRDRAQRRVAALERQLLDSATTGVATWMIRCDEANSRIGTLEKAYDDVLLLIDRGGPMDRIFEKIKDRLAKVSFNAARSPASGGAEP